ncbi:MAG: primosomal protein N' [Waddliaceae bacterium]
MNLPASTTSKTAEKYATVIMDVGIEKCLDYHIPSEMQPLITPGVTVEVPLMGRTRSGIVRDIKEKSEFKTVKSILRVVSDEVKITPELFHLAEWISKYYCSPLGKIIKSILPAPVRKSGKHKMQAFISRGRSREELRELCLKLRQTNPKQAAALDPMLKVNKGLFLSELIEQSGVSKSPIETLIKNGFLKCEQVKVDRSPLDGEEYFRSGPKTLNEDQHSALEKIASSIADNRFETHLLYGITGSGKTEVYLQAIAKARANGKGVIILVPEIALTVQTVERFKSRFEESIAVLHHRLSAGERFDEWHKILRGEVQIVIGARSAIFSPIQNLGLIIVDEEHDNSYKQSDESPCYHARDVAVFRGYSAKATVILGSATPSLESFKNAKSGKYTLSILSKRAEVAKLPKVSIIDMKEEYEKADGNLLFANPLLKKIKERFEKGEQSILFLNRRGYHAFLICKSCSSTIQCQHCDVTLTFHKSERQLRCHICGHTQMPTAHCPTCKAGDTLQYKGMGTERVERTLNALIPEIRTIRLDADTTRHKGSLQKLLRDFGTGKADVMIGTQMVAKGHHFPSVTLVGVLNPDAVLNLPDFRAQESIFQLITQVSGRAGRGEILGEVMIQTCQPDHPTLRFAAAQDYLAFYENEIQSREIFSYPPYSVIAKLTFSGKNEGFTFKSSDKFRREVLKKLPNTYQIHPALPSAYAKIKDNFRFQFIIRGPSAYCISQALKEVKASSPPPSSIKLLIDINPTQMS